MVLSLIARLQNPDIELREVEQVIAQDVILSFRLLRYINCATFGLRREVDSIRQALMLLGLATVRNWATLLLSQIDNHKPRELMTIALIRARMCELLANSDPAIDDNQAFTVGLFSLLDAMLDQPMETLLDQIPLSMPIKLALLDRGGNSAHCSKRLSAMSEANGTAWYYTVSPLLIITAPIWQR